MSVPCGGLTRVALAGGEAQVQTSTSRSRPDPDYEARGDAQVCTERSKNRTRASCTEVRMARHTESCSSSIFYHPSLGLSLTVRNIAFCRSTTTVVPTTRLSIVVNPWTSYIFPMLRSLVGVVCLNFTFVLTYKENGFEASCTTAPPTSNVWCFQ